jgi:hypothetical protein
MFTAKLFNSVKSFLYSFFGMKVILLGFFWWVSPPLYAQSADALLGGLKSGNAAMVAKHFEANIELTLLNTSSAFSKSQAEVVLRDFFAKKGVKGFELKHQGTSPEGSKYFVGTLQTGAGNYGTYIYGKVVNGQLTIRELRIEE